MARISNAELNGTFDRYVAARRYVGLPTEGLHMRFGSATYGQQYIIAQTINESSGISVVHGLGFRRAEVLRVLWALTSACYEYARESVHS